MTPIQTGLLPKRPSAQVRGQEVALLSLVYKRRPPRKAASGKGMSRITRERTESAMEGRARRLSVDRHDELVLVILL